MQVFQKVVKTDPGDLGVWYDAAAVQVQHAALGPTGMSSARSTASKRRGKLPDCSNLRLWDLWMSYCRRSGCFVAWRKYEAGGEQCSVSWQL